MVDQDALTIGRSGLIALNAGGENAVDRFFDFLKMGARGVVPAGDGGQSRFDLL
jgi:hypothetical protein